MSVLGDTDFCPSLGGCGLFPGYRILNHPFRGLLDSRHTHRVTSISQLSSDDRDSGRVVTGT